MQGYAVWYKVGYADAGSSVPPYLTNVVGVECHDGRRCVRGVRFVVVSLCTS